MEYINTFIENSWTVFGYSLGLYLICICIGLSSAVVTMLEYEFQHNILFTALRVVCLFLTIVSAILMRVLGLIVVISLFCGIVSWLM